MIDISQLSSLISAFRVETEKESISPETVGSILQDIADLLATATSETEHGIVTYWKDTVSQYGFIYDIEQRSVDDHNNVILGLKGRRMSDGSAFTITLPIGPATRNRAGVLTAEDYALLHNAGTSVEDIVDTVLELQDTVDAHSARLIAIGNANYVLQSLMAGNAHASKVIIGANKYNLANGQQSTSTNMLTIEGATESAAGAMTAQQVASLNTAKSDINALKAAMQRVQGGGALMDGIQMCLAAADRLAFEIVGYNLATGEHDVALQQLVLTGATTATAGLMTAQQVSQLNQLRNAVLSSNSRIGQFRNICIEIGHGEEALHLRGAGRLIDMGFTPYLFRYSRKRNRTNTGGRKGHGPLRKGWNVMGKADTVSIGNDETVTINPNVIMKGGYNESPQFRHEARFFVNDTEREDGTRRVSFGKTKIPLTKKVGSSYVPLKVRLRYGIAFASVKTGNRERLDPTSLVTPIVPFHVSTTINNHNYTWIFEK